MANTTDRIRSTIAHMLLEGRMYYNFEDMDRALVAVEKAVAAIGNIVREDEPKPAPTDRSWLTFEGGSVWD